MKRSIMELSHIGRRVLGHLPVWAEDEAAFIELEGGPEKSIRAYGTEEFTARLGEDSGTPAMTVNEVETCLGELAKQGLCTETEDGWRMTEAGFDALHEVRPQLGSAVVGPAFVDLHSASLDSNAIGA